MSKTTPTKPVEKQDAPFAMQIELSEGCNLRCTFCGLNAIRGKQNNFKFLTVKLAKRIANRIVESGWNPRLEFAMHGEPSANPKMIKILKAFRKRLPKTSMMMTSNGLGFAKDIDLVDESLKYLNVLALDNYDGIKLVPKILKRYDGAYKPIFYPEDSNGNPHSRRTINQHHFVIVADIADATKGTHATLNNHAGSGAPPNENAQGCKCAKPFREMSIRWDGSVAICCNDWQGIYKCGNVSTDSLETIWQGMALQSARRKLYHGMRDFGPCAGCDAISYRVGLLPDKMGKTDLPKPGKADRAVIKAAIAGKPYTELVPRPWHGPESTEPPF
jgi:MoaA/NifB/PqqE/SkfB family radical SAM enzyme